MVKRFSSKQFRAIFVGEHSVFEDFRGKWDYKVLFLLYIQVYFSTLLSFPTVVCLKREVHYLQPKMFTSKPYSNSNYYF